MDRLLNRQELRFRSKAALKNIRVDPDGELPLVVPPPAPGEAEVRRIVGDLPWSGAGRTALEAYRKAADARITDADAWFKLGMALFDGNFIAESLESFRLAAKNSHEGSQLFSGLVWQGHVLDLLGRRDEALQAYRWALMVPGDPRMRHDQYGMVIDRRWVEERLKMPFAGK